MKICSALFVLFLILNVQIILGNNRLGEKENRNNYILVFQVAEFNSEIASTIEYFFNKILQPQDQLSIVTPQKAYSYSYKTRKNHSKEELIIRTKNICRRDITIGAVHYNQILEAMIQIVLEIGGGIESSSGSNRSDLRSQLVKYRQLIKEMYHIRKLNNDWFQKVSEYFKNKKGKNYLYIFYQRELKVVPARDAMENLRNNPDFKFDAMEVFGIEFDKEFLDIRMLKQIFKESAVTLNFIYIKKKARRRRGMEMKEFSGDIFNLLSQLSKATGGEVIATSKPEKALEKIVKTGGKVTIESVKTH
jgi:hypothetical protein